MFSCKDLVHGKIALPDFTIGFIESAHFQRLRNLKQLGVSYTVFKKATHTRYEHCIGTAYICEQLLKCIEQSAGKIDELLKKCVILAGLLHDIGHGPFSHLWEHCVHQTDINEQQWVHENQSVAMFKDMIERYQISLHDDKDKHNFAIKLISSLITGDCEMWKELLKPSEFYLTEIVSNKFCNIDVDKCDYLLRDNYHVQEEILDFKDFFFRARICTDNDGTTHIAYHINDFPLIENMFINRAKYHMKVYQLDKVCGVERQLQDIFILAAHGGLKIDDLPITKVQNICSSYLHLDDTILDRIQSSNIDNQFMNEAKSLLKRFNNEDFYQFIWESSDGEEVNSILKNLKSKFGDHFCVVNKKIPNADIPKNIPLYDNSGVRVQKTSAHSLRYESALIFYKAFDDEIRQSILNFLNNNNYF